LITIEIYEANLLPFGNISTSTTTTTTSASTAFYSSTSEGTISSPFATTVGVSFFGLIVSALLIL
jgi:hypothetical protein